MKCHNCDFTRCPECGFEHLECPKCAAKSAADLARELGFPKPKLRPGHPLYSPELGSSEEGGM